MNAAIIGGLSLATSPGFLIAALLIIIGLGLVIITMESKQKTH